MSLAAFYPHVKTLHMGLALASGTLFALRGAGALAGARWPQSALARHGSMTIDSLLLLAALALLAVLHLNPFAVPWLLVKLITLVAYIVLGTLALKRARSWGRRAAAYMAALVAFGFMVSVARAHHPLGFLARLAG